jgi:hypothetical protein
MPLIDYLSVSGFPFQSTGRFLTFVKSPMLQCVAGEITPAPGFLPRIVLSKLEVSPISLVMALRGLARSTRLARLAVLAGAGLNCNACYSCPLAGTPTVGVLTPISSAMARSDFSGFQTSP